MTTRRKQSKQFDDSEGEVVLGRWTRDEHKRFVEALSIHGKNWKRVEEHVGTRSGAQIRSHAQKFFNRLEKEFNQQFNGLKSSEIKQIFENKLFHKYYESDQQKRPRQGSINDILSEEELQPNMESLEQDQQQQSQHPIQDIPQKGDQDQKLLDLAASTILQNNILQEQINQLQIKIQILEEKSKETQNQTIKNDLINEAIQFKHQKNEMEALLQFQNAYNSISTVLRPAPDESFFHFIIAKYSNYLSFKGINLSDLITESIQQDVQENQTGEVQKSRKQSFSFYNEQIEDNQQKYNSLKKVKKD